MTRIVLVRHGQTCLNRGDRIRGRLDPPLDEAGTKQAQRTAQYVASRWPAAAVYSSPLRRATQTAEAIAHVQHMVATPFDGLLDLDFGEWHGLSFSEAREQYPTLHRAWREAPHTVRFPEGECLDDVRQRAMAGIRMIERAHDGETVVMVGHTVVNRVVLCAVLGVPNSVFWRLGQDTCAVNVISVAPDGSRALILMNDTSHLSGPQGASRIPGQFVADGPPANAPVRP